MKKGIGLFIVMIMSLFLCMSSFASETTKMNIAANPDSAPSPQLVGILTADDGTQQEIIGTLVSTNTTPNSRSLNCVEATYKYDLEVSPRATGGSKTEYGEDGGYASTVYLTINYSYQNSPTEYLLTGVSGRWEITDGKASVESATVSYGCSGQFPKLTTQAVQNKSVTNNFKIQTGFTNYIISDVNAVLGAHLTVNYLMGTSRRWSFTLSNLLFNN